jgi:hypothetical protein
MSCNYVTISKNIAIIEFLNRETKIQISKLKIKTKTAAFYIATINLRVCSYI